MKTRLLRSIVALALLGLLSAGIPAFGEATTVTYQGTLRDAAGQEIPDGAYDINFSIWNAVSGGSMLWQENHAAVPTKSSSFSVLLGTTTAFGDFFAENRGIQLWLSITADFGAGPVTYVPRTLFSRIPFAKDAHTVDGNHASLLGARIGSVVPIALGYTGVPTLEELKAKGWALCNGQTPAVQGITGAVLSGMTPDMNVPGRFLRGSATAGVTQADGAGVHTHTAGFSGSGGTGGDHGHGYSLSTSSDGNHAHPQNVTANPNTGGVGIRRDFDQDTTGLTVYSQGINTDAAGTHAHSLTGSISTTGAHTHTLSGTATVNSNNVGGETRPVNMALVYFIKVK